MKYNLINILKKLGESVSLSSSEKEKLARVVSEYVSFKPRAREKRASEAPAAGFFAFGMRPLALALSLAIVVSGAGVSYAAELSVPGDILYPIKVSVNEEVRAAFATTPEKRASFAAERAEKRLDEAATLAVSGKLDDTKREDLEARFAKHAAEATAQAETFEETDTSAAVDFAANFETRLAAHEALLNEFDDSGKRLGFAIREKARMVGVLRLRAEGRFKVARTAPEGATRRATLQAADESSGASGTDAPEQENNAGESVVEHSSSGEGGAEMPSGIAPEVLERARIVSEKALLEAVEKLGNKASKLSDENKKTANELIEQARSDMEEADRALKRGEFVQALALFRKSLALSQKFIVFVDAAVHLDIRIAAPVRNAELEIEVNPVRLRTAPIEVR